MLECTHCVCERACVHKVPPCKCLIVCVGNNSPIPQGMKQARKRPGPQTSGGPPGHGTPRRTTAGTTAASTQKGQRRARRRDLRQPQCRRPRLKNESCDCCLYEWVTESLINLIRSKPSHVTTVFMNGLLNH